MHEYIIFAVILILSYIRIFLYLKINPEKFFANRIIFLYVFEFFGFALTTLVPIGYINQYIRIIIVCSFSMNIFILEQLRYKATNHMLKLKTIRKYMEFISKYLEIIEDVLKNEEVDIYNLIEKEFKITGINKIGKEDKGLKNCLIQYNNKILKNIESTTKITNDSKNKLVFKFKELRKEYKF